MCFWIKDTIPTGGVTKHSPPDNTSSKDTKTDVIVRSNDVIKLTPLSGDEEQPYNPRYHDLEVLSADFDLVGGCDVEHNSSDVRNSFDDDTDDEEENEKSQNGL